MNCTKRPSQMKQSCNRLAATAPRQLLTALISMLVLWLAVGCEGSTLATLAESQDEGVPPTPTLLPVDPQELLIAVAVNTKTIESMRFSLVHTSGSIYIDTLSAKITDVTGVWDASQGAELSIDGYLVSGPGADILDGIFVRLKLVITPDSYYLVDPTTRTWTKQPVSLIPLSIEQLAEILSDLIGGIENAKLEGDERVNGIRAYRVSGNASASVMEWTTLSTENRPDVRVEIWVNVENLMPVKARVTGPIGEFDDLDTVREITLSDINSPLVISVPQNYVDVTGR